MNSNFPPNTDPNTFALVGAIAGAIISNEFNLYELNAIGNWLELVGQYLLAAAAQAQLINYRNNQNNSFNYQNQQSQLDNLKKAIQKIYEELEKIRN